MLQINVVQKVAYRGMDEGVIALNAWPIWPTGLAHFSDLLGKLQALSLYWVQ